MIPNFNAIPGLYACYHAGESTTEVEPNGDGKGDNVVSVSPAYPGLLPLDVNAVPGPENAKVRFKGDKIGEMPAWSGNVAGYCNLTATISPVVDWSSTGFTLLRVDQYHGTGNSESGGIYNADGCWPDYRSVGGNYQVRWWAGGNDNGTTVPYTSGVPQISVAVNNPDPNPEIGGYTLTVGTNSESFGYDDHRAPRTDNQYLVFCGGMNPFQMPNAGYGFSGLTSMFVLYNKVLNQDEINEIVELANYWVNAGEAPTDIPTSTSFGPVLTEDLLATLKWKWSTDQVDWYDVDDVSNGLDSVGIEATETSGQVNGKTQDRNKLDIVEAYSPQTVYLKCVATTGYTPDGLDSNVNTLTVVEAT